MKIKFHGFQPDSRVTLSASQDGVTRGPLTISAWQPRPVGGEGTFKVYVNQVPTLGGSRPANTAIHKGREIADGGLIEAVAPLPLMVVVDNFAGFSVNDARQLYIDVDYGERYEALYHDPANFPAELTMPLGSTLGRYVGFVSGHSLRGVDMTGAPRLTPTNATIETPITVTVSDGLQTQQISFRTRLYHPDVYYTDRDKSVYYPTAPESNRRGIVYFSRDGDFTGALPEQSQTSTRGGIYHYHKPDGILSEFTWQGDKTGNGGPNFPFNNNNIGCIDIRLKGGERWFVNKEMVPQGNNSRVTSWGPGQAILDPTRIRQWTGRPAMIALNGGGQEGLRLDNLHFECSDYDPRSIERRDWWNILNYSARSGTFVENSGNNTNTLNGEIVTNGNGVYAQIIGDTGTSLIVRQVVDNADPNADAAQPATFAEGDTLTGVTSGATVTFVAAGSRQDRTVRWPSNGIAINDLASCCIDRCQISGASTGIANIGPGAVISDTWIRNWFDYGFFGGGQGTLDRWLVMSGCALTQPVGFISEPRDFGTAVASAREEWNVMRLDDPTQPMPNAPAHTAHRHSFILAGGYHKNKVHTYGGHGAGHQPAFRIATRGSDAEDLLMVVFHGNGISGGAVPINFGIAVGGVYPYTPRGILIEANHLLGQEISSGALIALNFTATTVRNNLFEYPAGQRSSGVGFIGFSKETYTVNPDVNAKDITVEFNTFVVQADNNGVANDVGRQNATLRGNPVTWRNNAYAIDAAKVGSLSADMADKNDNPATDYSASWKPLATSKAYQSATPPVFPKDAASVDRPNSGASKGAFEPGS